MHKLQVINGQLHTADGVKLLWEDDAQRLQPIPWPLPRHVSLPAIRAALRDDPEIPSAVSTDAVQLPDGRALPVGT